MPRKKRRSKGKRCGKLHKALCEKDVNGGDLAIEDFANAKDAKEALKRVARGFSSSAAIVSEAEKENMIPWYERTDFDTDFDSLSAEEGECESPAVVNTQDKTTSRSRGSKKNAKKKDITCKESDECGLIYPLDVWCLLAEYIRPEHVQKFALICKGARQAINMRTFWLRLYERHISQPKKLPERLQPDTIECRPGLRARIIRALFHGYEPFRTRILSQSNLRDPSSLESHMCISMWYKQALCNKQTKKVWVFYFKFSQKAAHEKRKPRYFSQRWFEQVDDLNENPEENHTILQVNCVNFLPLSPIQGHVLTKALVGISRDMKYNSIKLTFHSPRSDGRYRKEGGTVVILDPAYDAKVINWWSPLYPHFEDAM
ncbi:transmembrane protein 183-like isoform X2 [Oculina patagonica]